MELNKVMLSIVIPCYNCEKFIDKCVKSIIKNSYQNIEIILVNDGSKDKTLDVIKKLENKFSCIHAYSKMNTGVSDTRNYGISLSNGRYIAFIDSDDYITDNMMKKMIDIAEENNVDMVCCDFMEQKGNSIIKSKFNYKTGLYSSDHILKEFLTGKISISIWDKIFKKELLNDIKFNTNLAVGEDSLFCIETIRKAQNIYILGNALYVYVQNEESAVHSISKKILQISTIEKYINKDIIINHEKEYNYFVADCMLRCIHTLSVCYDKNNKEKVYKYIKEIYNKPKIKEIIISKYSSFYSRVEMTILYFFGINVHLNMFKFYKYIRKMVRSK